MLASLKRILCVVVWVGGTVACGPKPDTRLTPVIEVNVEPPDDQDSDENSDDDDVENPGPDVDGGVPIPLCPGISACPTEPSTFEKKLMPIDPCAYRVKGAPLEPSRQALIAELDKTLTAVSPVDVALDGNREATRLDASDVPEVNNFQFGFKWNDGDNEVTYWYPQGITGSADSSATGMVSGKRIVLVSWYFKTDAAGAPEGDRGVRISFVDITDPARIRYRHALLVEPYRVGTRVSFRAVDSHAGGLVWLGRYLFVPATFNGFQVYDLQHIFEVNEGNSIGWDEGSQSYRAYDYKYVIPMVGRFVLPQESCTARFSFAALDRTSTPISIVTGEFFSGPGGRIFRWPLNPNTNSFVHENGVVVPTEAFYTGKTQMQGGLMNEGRAMLSCGNQYGTDAKLYRLSPTGSTTFNWPKGPEDLYYEHHLDALWTITEHRTDRYAFSRTMP
jgi:hypothetical protein